jgi:hypothetical protein
MMSPQERINTKIKATSDIINDINIQMDKLGLPDFVKELQLSSLNQRVNDLMEENEEILRVADKEEFIVTMHPNLLPSGYISVRELTVILGGLQNLTDSIANTLYNQPSEKGKIPLEILERNSLILKETRAGSFKAVLELPHSEQGSFDEPVQTETITELFSLFSASDVPDHLTETISSLGPRALRYYKEWTKSLKELNTSVDIEWLSSYKEPSKISISSHKAESIYDILSNFSETSEEEVEVHGRLTGANVRTKSFEIVTNIGEKISGRIMPDAIAPVACFELSTKCIAELLKVTTTYASNGKQKVSWTLKDIKIDNN